MGCDIHAFVETKSKTDASGNDWDFLSTYRFSRNYAMFALMASVRRYEMWPDPATLEKALLKRGVTRLDDPKLSAEEGGIIMMEGCDNGITKGQPSFEVKGIPQNISWKTAEEYTLCILEDDDDSEESHTCKRSQADSWVEGGSSEIWDRDAQGDVMRVTNPDWHTGSWLDAGEVRDLSIRFREVLIADFPEAKKIQAQSIVWAQNGLKKAKAANDAEQITFFEREIERESNWDSHNPLRDRSYACVDALTALMDALDAHGISARLVFWFDN